MGGIDLLMPNMVSHRRLMSGLPGTTSAPFQPGEHGQVAVKVIDDRGNELMVVKVVT